jgi:hypothetical protein
MKATLLLDTELVVDCEICGTPSSASITGRSGWALVSVSAQRMADVCPDCQPRPLRATTAAGRRAR